MIYWFSFIYTNTIRFIVSLKPWWKLCLVRWLKPWFNVFNSLIQYGIWVTNVENPIMRKSSKLQKHFMKRSIHSEYRISRRSLFHSNVEERKIYKYFYTYFIYYIYYYILYILYILYIHFYMYCTLF